MLIHFRLSAAVASGKASDLTHQRNIPRVEQLLCGVNHQLFTTADVFKPHWAVVHLTPKSGKTEKNPQSKLSCRPFQTASSHTHHAQVAGAEQAASQPEGLDLSAQVEGLISLLTVRHTRSPENQFAAMCNKSRVP